MLRRIHRVLGVLLVLPLFLWTATGLLFLVKPGWRGAYELLDPFHEERLDLASLVPLSLVVGEPGASGTVSRLELVSTALGPLYRLSGPGGATRLVDARTGSVLSPLGSDAGAKVAADAAGRAQASARYGAITAAREEGDAIRVSFAGGAEIRVGRDDLSLSQSGADTSWIDALYRIHYLQWTGIAAVDGTLELAAIAGTWALAALGLCLFRRPRSDRSG